MENKETCQWFGVRTIQKPCGTCGKDCIYAQIKSKEYKEMVEHFRESDFPYISPEAKAQAFYNAGYRKIYRGGNFIGHKVLKDTTLQSLSKNELIEYIRVLEYNWSSAEETNSQQAKNFATFEMLAIKEFAERLRLHIFETPLITENGVPCITVEKFNREFFALLKGYGIIVTEE